MTWLLNRSTRAKLLLGFGLMVAILAILAVASYLSITTVRDAQRTLYEQHFLSTNDVQEIRYELNRSRALVLAMSLLSSVTEQQAIEKEVRESDIRVDDRMKVLLERNSNDRKLLDRLKAFDNLRKSFTDTRYNQVIPSIYGGQGEEARRLILGGQAGRDEQMRVMTKDITDDSLRQAQLLEAQSDQMANTLVVSILIVGLLAILLATAAALALTSYISKPLVAISRTAELIAAGNLTVALPSNERRDEVGVLLKGFGAMVENLRRQTREMRDGVTVLSSSASEIASATMQLAASTAETATAISETTASVEEVKQTAQVASQKAKGVAESSQRAAQVSQLGKKAADDMLEGMRRIKEQMGLIAESLVRLSEQGQAIGAITASVDDLAQQSNLLAVNAAIEAAKAGEHGKGFGVVAQEIKSLAGQSKQATTQVRSILNEVQKAVGAAVMVTEQGGKAVDAGVAQAAQAGESIVALAESVAEAAQAASQIAVSSQQQLVGMDQVALAMESVNKGGSQNLESTKQVEQAARNIDELGARLKRLAERYRIDQ